MIRTSDLFRIAAAPVLRSFLIAFLACFVLVMPEWAIYVLRNPAWLLEGLARIGALMFCLAVFYAVLIEASYQISLAVGSLLLRFEKYSTGAAPGLVLFIIIGMPLQAYFPSPESGELLRGVLFFFICLATGIVCSYFFPFFRGLNAPLLLAAAIASRTLLVPFWQGGTPLEFLIHVLNLALTGFLIFIVLQVVHRLHLAAGYENVPPPKPLLWIGVALAGLAVVLQFLGAIPDLSLTTASTEYGIEVAGLGMTGLARQYGIPTTVFVLCLVHWAVAATFLTRDRGGRLTDHLQAYQRSLLLSLALLLACVPAGFLAGTARPSLLGQIVAARGVTSDVLSVAGALLDFDGDGNSRWPGQDPDDSDPCVRYDVRDICQAVPSPARLTPAEFVGASEEVAPGRTTIVFFSFGRSDPPGVRSEFRRSAPAFRALSQGLPTDRFEHSLRALFQDLNGIEEYLGVDGRSLWSRFAADGFRTICVGYDGGRGYWKANGLIDRGCQVLEAVPDSVARSPDEAARNSILRFRAYREDRTVLWFHYDPPPGAPADREALLRTLSILREPGGVLVVLFKPNPGEFTADLWALGRSLPDELPADPRLGDLMRHLAGTTREPILSRGMSFGVMYDQPFATSWARSFIQRFRPGYPKYPVFTFAHRGGSIRIFDALSGAEWTP